MHSESIWSQKVMQSKCSEKQLSTACCAILFALLFWQIKSVCSKLRSCGVQGHLGVFGVHYETDNSRLYIVCTKHLTEAQLLNEFKVFGTVEVKLITYVNGFSKVDLFSFIFFFLFWSNRY